LFSTEAPLLAKDLGRLSAKDYDNLNGQAIDVKRMLAGLIQKLKPSPNRLAANGKR
jgi:hypothetical protein